MEKVITESKLTSWVVIKTRVSWPTTKCWSRRTPREEQHKEERTEQVINCTYTGGGMGGIVMKVNPLQKHVRVIANVRNADFSGKCGGLPDAKRSQQPHVVCLVCMWTLIIAERASEECLQRCCFSAKGMAAELSRFWM